MRLSSTAIKQMDEVFFSFRRSCCVFAYNEEGIMEACSDAAFLCLNKRKLWSLGNIMINSWYSVSLGDGVWAPVLFAQIVEVFQPRFDAAGKPVEMAVFTRSETEGRLHCEVIAYFSPASGEVAKAFAAEPCEKPLREGLGLLAGDPHCWEIIFAESSVLFLAYRSSAAPGGYNIFLGEIEQQ